MNKYFTLLLIASLVSLINADQRLVTREFDQQVFNTDAVKGWSISGNKGGRLISSCEKDTVFGGFDVFGQGAVASKSFNSGVNHYELEISFELFAIDSWDDESFSFKVDGVERYTYSTQFSKVPAQGSRIISCGSGNWPDKHVKVAFTIPHSSKKFSINLSSTLNQDANDESWGIKNLQIVANYPGNNSQIISSEFDQNNFVENYQGWVITPALLNPFSNCGKDRIFGGYNLFGAKTTISKNFSNLPEHWGIVVEVTLWFVDSVDTNNFVYVVVDGQRYQFTRTSFDFSQNHICGSNNWGENVQQLSIFFPHATSTATVTFYDDFDQGKDDESWGIQNLVITAMTGNSDKQTLAVNEFSDNDFTSAPGWKTLQGVDVSNRITKCGGATIFGGYKQLSREQVFKEYKNLPLHTGVRIFFQLFAIDSWDNEPFNISVDNVRVLGQRTPLFVDTDICGASQWKDRIQHYFIDVKHVGSTLKLAFLSGLNQDSDDESYGIRNLKIWTYVGPQTKIISNEFDDYALWAAGNWSVKPDVNPKITQCGPYQLFGGYNTFGLKTTASRKYDNLPEHNKVIISFKIFFIDTWDKERLIVSVDGNDIGSATKGETWEGQEHLCGWSAAKEEVYTLQFSTYHQDSSFTLSIRDTLDQSKDDESWGIRDLVVAVQKSTEYENTDSCVVIYSECDYGGKKLTVCNNIPDLAAVGWTEPVRSIQVPKNVRSRVFEQVNYQGGSYAALQDVKCVVGAAFVQLNNALGIQVNEEVGTKLRKQN